MTSEKNDDTINPFKNGYDHVRGIVPPTNDEIKEHLKLECKVDFVRAELTCRHCGFSEWGSSFDMPAFPSIGRYNYTCRHCKKTTLHKFQLKNHKEERDARKRNIS